MIPDDSSLTLCIDIVIASQWNKYVPAGFLRLKLSRLAVVFVAKILWDGRRLA